MLTKDHILITRRDTPENSCKLTDHDTTYIKKQIVYLNIHTKQTSYTIISTNPNNIFNA